MSFEREFLGIPWEPSPLERELRKLAEEYHQRTEEYDRTVCSGPVVHGAVMPCGALERFQVTTHAKRVFNELWAKAEAAGAHRFQWCQAVSDVGREFRFNR